MSSIQQTTTEEMAVSPKQVVFNYYDGDKPEVVISEPLSVDELYQVYSQWVRSHDGKIPMEWLIRTELIAGVATAILDVADWDVTVDEYGDIVGNYQLMGCQETSANAFIFNNGGMLFIHRPSDPKRLFHSLQRQGVNCSFDEDEMILSLPEWSVVLNGDLSFPFIPKGGVADYVALSMHQPEQMKKMMEDIMQANNQEQVLTNTAATEELAAEAPQSAMAEALTRALNEQATEVTPAVDTLDADTEVIGVATDADETVSTDNATPASPAPVAVAVDTEVVEPAEEEITEDAPVPTLLAVSGSQSLLISGDADAETEQHVLPTSTTGLAHKSSRKPRRNRDDDEFASIPDPTKSGMARNTRYGSSYRDDHDHAERPRRDKPRVEQDRREHKQDHKPVKAEQSIDYASIGRVRMDNGVLNMLKDRMIKSMPKDGIDSINIGSAATTELGKKLVAHARTPFVHPELGSFDTLLGFQYYILSKDMDNSLRTLSGTSLRKWKRNNQLHYFDGWMKVVGEAFWLKVNLVPGLVEQLVGNDLPFRSYYIDQQADQEVIVPTVDEPWMVALLNEIVRTLKARAKAKDEQARLKILPNFHFTTAMENRKPVPNYRRNRQ